MRTVPDRYELCERLGGGATADVYRAQDRLLGRDVALKVMRPAMAEDVELLGRFEREAATLARVAHPNVVTVLDHGTFDGAPYLAMDLVDGPTLQQLVRERGRVGEDDARSIGAQIAAALEVAHAHGVIHRDLKPANVLVSRDGTVKVTDFGVAHLEALTQLTRTGEVLGTPKYIAPEQIHGRIDTRSDIYALGVILYELVTGRPPFDGETAVEIVGKQLRARPVPPRQLGADISARFERVILRALEKDPAKRQQTAGEIRSALRPPESAPVVAIAARARRLPSRAAPPRAASAGRALGTLVATVLGVVLLAGGAAARIGDARPFWVGAGSAPSAAPVSNAVSRPSPAPVATPAATATTEPTATPVPSATPEASAPPARTAVPGAVAAGNATDVARPATAGDPRATVALFYQLVSAHRYDDAAALWSARMRAAYPPSTNIAGRFDRTASITLRSSSIATQSDTAATVNVDIVEILTDGTTRHWVGQWYLVRSGTSWLMDAPALRAG